MRLGTGPAAPINVSLRTEVITPGIQTPCQYLLTYHTEKLLTFSPSLFLRAVSKTVLKAFEINGIYRFSPPEGLLPAVEIK